MEYFPKLVNGFKPLTIFAKCFTLNVSQGFEYTHGYAEMSLSIFPVLILINLLRTFTGRHYLTIFIP